MMVMGLAQKFSQFELVLICPKLFLSLRRYLPSFFDFLIYSNLGPFTVVTVRPHNPTNVLLCCYLGWATDQSSTSLLPPTTIPPPPPPPHCWMEEKAFSQLSRAPYSEPGLVPLFTFPTSPFHIIPSASSSSGSANFAKFNSAKMSELPSEI